MHQTIVVTFGKLAHDGTLAGVVTDDMFVDVDDVVVVMGDTSVVTGGMSVVVGNSYIFVVNRVVVGDVGGTSVVVIGVVNVEEASVVVDSMGSALGTCEKPHQFCLSGAE